METKFQFYIQIAEQMLNVKFDKKKSPQSIMESIHIKNSDDLYEFTKRCYDRQLTDVTFYNTGDYNYTCEDCDHEHEDNQTTAAIIKPDRNNVNNSQLVGSKVLKVENIYLSINLMRIYNILFDNQ